MDLDVLEQLRVLNFFCLGVLVVHPNRRRTAVGVADPQVVEVELVSTGFGAFEDDGVPRQDSGPIAGKSDDAMLPHPWAALRLRPGDLLTTELIQTFAAIEIKFGALAFVAFEG